MFDRIFIDEYVTDKTSVNYAPVDEVSKVIQQFTVVLQHQVIPAKRTVLIHTSKCTSINTCEIQMHFDNTTAI